MKNRGESGKGGGVLTADYGICDHILLKHPTTLHLLFLDGGGSEGVHGRDNGSGPSPLGILIYASPLKYNNFSDDT